LAAILSGIGIDDFGVQLADPSRSLSLRRLRALSGCRELAILHLLTRFPSI
jgi:hypothetical protein